MFDSIANSADGLLVLLYVIALVVFFLFGPHKVYESLFGALVGLGLYLFVHEITFIYPQITQATFSGNWIFENRGTILWFSKGLTLGLFFITPITLGLNVSGVVRGTVWFFIKTIILSAFFISFSVIVFRLVSIHNSEILGEAVFLPFSFEKIPYFQNAYLFRWLVDKTTIVILIGFLLALYKIIFSHWVSRLLFFGSVLYVKSNEIFGKKNLDTVTPIEMTYDDHGESHQSEEHH